jgi:hypothetical protein
MKILKAIPILLFISLISPGCGGSGGGNGNNNDVNVNQLVGTYSLVEFTIEFDNGITMTQNSVSSFSGTMTITTNGNMTQSVSVNGNEVSVSGTYSIISNSILRLTFSGCTYDLGYSFNNNILTTLLESGTCGANFSESDVWQKTSSLVSINASLANEKFIQRNMNINNIGHVKTVGGLIAQYITPNIE